MTKKSVKSNSLLVGIMIFAYAAAVGTLINAIFAVAGTGGKDPSVVRLFTIAICFFIAGTILKKVIKKQRG